MPPCRNARSAQCPGISRRIVLRRRPGHETTGSLLSWVWLCLHNNPDARTTLQQELTTQLNGQTPTIAQLDDLPYLRGVIEETLRLYPSIWHIVRRATKADQLGEYHLPKGASIFICQYALHRNPLIWEDPETFKPERFDKQHANAFPAKLNYLPFGFGPRTCIAGSMALLQAKIVIAILAQQFDFKLVGEKHIKKEFLISMRPQDGIRAIAIKRF